MVLFPPVVLGAVFEIKNSGVFYGAAGVIFAYLLYIIIRPRKGARPESREDDAEL